MNNINIEKTSKIKWLIGKTNYKEIEDKEKERTTQYLEMEPFEYLTYSDLPIEFFNHQLLDVNHENVKDVINFIEKFGFPFSPIRNMKDVVLFMNPISHITNKENELLDVAFSPEMEMFEHKDAIESTESLIETLKKNDRGLKHVISLEEASYSIFLLQMVVNNLLGYDCDPFNSDTWLYFSKEVVNRCSCSIDFFDTFLEIKPNESLYDRGLLTSAICSQILETFSSDLPWKKCANTNCSKVFKRKQSGAISANSKTLYCCKKCQEQQKKRNQRNAAKNRRNPAR